MHFIRNFQIFHFILCALTSLASPNESFSQSMKEMLKQAEANYPLLKSKAYELQARREQLSQARSTALPSLDAGYQLNYATYNNLTGMAAGQTFLPISGPPSTDNVYQPVFGSAAGLFLDWEPFAFGRRQSKIESARASQNYQQADVSNEIFQHQIRTIYAYLELLMINEVVRLQNENVARSAENARVARRLAGSGLRPATDTAQFMAELSTARIELLRYQKLQVNQEILLSTYTGVNEPSATDSTFFGILPGLADDAGSHSHPLIDLSVSKMNMGMQEKTSLQRMLYPKLSFWGTAYARGSGIRYDGYVNSQDGLSFSRYNYGAGMMVSLPLLRFTNLRYQVRAQESMIKAEEEKVNLVRLQIDKQLQAAKANMTSALEIARESPVALQASEFSWRGMKSRYASGLANYAELLQAQYTLMKSETDQRKAYVDAWKALLYVAAMQGDINLFLNQVN